MSCLTAGIPSWEDSIGDRRSPHCYTTSRAICSSKLQKLRTRCECRIKNIYIDTDIDLCPSHSGLQFLNHSRYAVAIEFPRLDYLETASKVVPQIALRAHYRRSYLYDVSRCSTDSLQGCLPPRASTCYGSALLRALCAGKFHGLPH
jgi:hypothetical protein